MQTFLVTGSDRGIGEAFIIMSEVLRYDEGVRHLSEVSGMGWAAVPFPRAEFYEYDLTCTREARHRRRGSTP